MDYAMLSRLSIQSTSVWNKSENDAEIEIPLPTDIDIIGIKCIFPKLCLTKYTFDNKSCMLTVKMKEKSARLLEIERGSTAFNNNKNKGDGI